MYRAAVVDITGETHNRLTALRPTDKRYNGEVIWLWQCECGNLTETRPGTVRSGRMKSCGCLRRELARQRASRNLHYRLSKGENHPRWKGDDVSYDGTHRRIRANRGSASSHICVDCGEQAREWSYEGSCPDEKLDESNLLAYCLHDDHYSPRCKPCHGAYDKENPRKQSNRGSLGSPSLLVRE